MKLMCTSTSFTTLGWSSFFRMAISWYTRSRGPLGWAEPSVATLVPRGGGRPAGEQGISGDESLFNVNIKTSSLSLRHYKNKPDTFWGSFSFLYFVNEVSGWSQEFMNIRGTNKSENLQQNKRLRQTTLSMLGISAQHNDDLTNQNTY